MTLYCLCRFLVWFACALVSSTLEIKSIFVVGICSRDELDITLLKRKEKLWGDSIPLFIILKTPKQRKSHILKLFSEKIKYWFFLKIQNLIHFFNLIISFATRRLFETFMREWAYFNLHSIIRLTETKPMFTGSVLIPHTLEKGEEQHLHPPCILSNSCYQFQCSWWNYFKTSTPRNMFLWT